MNPCPKCGSKSVGSDINISAKISGYIVEASVECHSCKFNTSPVTLWSALPIEFEDDIYSRALFEAKDQWARLKKIKQDK